MSLRLKLLNAYLKRIERPALSRLNEPREVRDRFALIARRVFKEPPGIRFNDCELDGVPGIEARPVAPIPRTAILYLHGGGFFFGAAETHRKITGALAGACGMAAFVPDYRLAPEYPFPAALDDCERAHDALRTRGYERIILIGESAGGGLVFSLLARLISKGARLPVAAIGLSPAADLHVTADSYTRNDRTEVVLPPDRIAASAVWYRDTTPADHPEVSPVFADFTGAPPCLIHVSGVEVLEDDAHALAAKLRDDGVEVLLRTWDHTPHGWHLFHGFLPEADEAIADIADFVSLNLKDA